MTSLQAYKQFLLKINKNDTNSNIKINKGQFVLIFNEQARVWIYEKLKEDSDDAEKNYFSKLLIFDEKLNKLNDLENFSTFELPKNYLSIESAYSIAKKEECKRKLYNFDFKAMNRNVLEQDLNNAPSFEFETTLYNLSNNNLVVFKTDFTIEEEYISYYRLPIEIDIDGYIKIDGTQSINIDPELDDKYVEEIINRCVVEVQTNYSDLQNLQASQNRVQKDKF